jgi:hypothetical protein
MRFLCTCAAKSALLRFAMVISAGLAVAAVAGCSERDALSSAKFYPVKGKVLLPDGKPLTSGSVVFVGSKSMVTSTTAIGSDGSFAFKSASGDGLPEGEYKIRIEGSGSGGSKSKTNLPFANQFLDEDASKLTATVTSDGANNNFELKLNPTSSEQSGGENRGRR